MLRQTDIILAIESSCDDTAAAVLKDRKVLSNCVANQNLIHKAYGGIVPELASRAHQSKIIPVVSHALTEANIDKKELTAIAYTQGPGLLGSLLVGSSFAKSLSIALNIPLLPINHMQGHILAHFIEDENFITPDFPFLGVTLSGGHTQLILVKKYFEMELIGTTLDDAIGEAFDKCGKIMGLEYPAGPLIDKNSLIGNPNKFKFTVPKVEGLDFSFSGLKTNFKRCVEKGITAKESFLKEELNNLCSSIQSTIVKILSLKIEAAVNKTGIKNIVFGGGVSANSGIRNYFNKNKNLNVFFPKREYTTDNAAMIAMVGYLKFKNKKFSSLDVVSKARYKI
jgi:N6-L-threonylcarbamoyladenine synthase